jgi:hypothetical protein
MSNITHNDLVRAAKRWLQGRCKVVLSELTKSREIPDGIGWTPNGYSLLVECKVTRSDFLADGKKNFRRIPSLGMGRERYYLAPKGLIHISEIPEMWGLLEYQKSRHKTGHMIRRMKRPVAFDEKDTNARSEKLLLIEATYRSLESLRMLTPLSPGYTEDDPELEMFDDE